ncbi:tryptophan synthase subunit alpha [Hymenobacter busanensis]|uniref:Tryptophan synthase alpha chain n=1 Tax=Hymenobacter busanensis TaxID=2607656 RepID=A0A7L4ZTU8_9BACT|nr:tryptophan synthase subunit alpha [Hymenobacter busanensis]KAA9339390.1 tryptophan synthase subunit alpha [Hymenobacter busanensis]QHJ06849.1 tryptophan synthase subunit alpha [Hymenobacter busanensis]
MVNRFADLFARKPSGVLNLYITAGYPSLHDTVPLLKTLAESGADVLEIGVPFSDPLADGPVIQQTSSAALRNGMTLKLLLQELQGIRQVLPDTPLLLMGYLNPVLQYGMEAFCQQTAAAGIDGVILPDLPAEEYAALYQETFRRHNLRPVFLITPQTAEARIRRLDELTDDAFLYLVSGPGLTGGNQTADHSSQDAYLARVEALNLRNPRLVGFGIADKTSFERACQHAHGAIIGSALLRALDGAADPHEAARQFVRSIRQ